MTNEIHTVNFILYIQFPSGRINSVVPQRITLLRNHTNTVSFLQSYPL